VIFFFATVSKLYSALLETFEHLKTNSRKFIPIKFILIKGNFTIQGDFFSPAYEKKFIFELNFQNYQSGFLCFATQNIPTGIF
jgi:hypothetical protein